MVSLLRNNGVTTAIRASEETVITVPEHVLRAALRAFDSRDPAAAVAQLVDEACEEAGPVVTRHLCFAGLGLDIDLHVTGAGDQLVVSVDLRPPIDCSVELDHRGGTLRTRTSDGHCDLARVEHGPVRVTVEGTGGRNPRRTQTTWVSL